MIKFIFQTLKYLIRLILVIILTPLSFLGLWSSWVLISTSKQEWVANRENYISGEEERCSKLEPEAYNNCMESAWLAIGGESIYYVFVIFGVPCFLLLSFLIYSWTRKILATFKERI